jgi:hypothetical protein
VDDDQNVINIDLSANSQKSKANDIAKDIGKIDINQEKLDGDDMLDLMDEADDY